MIKNPLPLPCMALSSRHAGWKPAHPCGAGVMECIAVCGLEARAPRWCIAVCGLEARVPSMRARRPRTQAVMFSGAIGSDCGGSGETLVFSEEM